ncbi:MAG TPA: PEGA domain-containing protein [Phycisphaerales bacterium]|nr:PEGA domain-containing protein [Phycisphaerales bacterium]
MKQAAMLVLVTAAAIGAGGCRTRTLEITSDPPGALVWLNDEQVGRTPLETGFVHYGDYEVRLRLDGYNPLVTHRPAGAPLIDQPGIDFVTQAFPGNSVTRWHFILEPLPELADQRGAESAAYDRAKAFRDHIVGSKPRAPAPQPSGDAGTPTTVTPSGTSPSTTAPAPTIDK